MSTHNICFHAEIRKIFLRMILLSNLELCLLAIANRCTVGLREKIEQKSLISFCMKYHSPISLISWARKDIHRFDFHMNDHLQISLLGQS